jgi:hypothetical protein
MELAIVFLSLLGIAVIVLPFVLLGMVAGLRRREGELQGQVRDLSGRLLELERKARATEKAATTRAGPTTEPKPAEVPRAAPAPIEPSRPLEPSGPAEASAPIEPSRSAAPRAAPAPLETVAVAPPPSASRQVTAPPAGDGDRFLPPPATPVPPASPLPPAASVRPSAVAPATPVATPPPPSSATAPRPPSPRAPVAARPPPPPRPPRPPLMDRLRGFDWERIVGVKLFSILAGVVLAIAAIYAIILSVEAGIFGPRVRFAVLTLVGATLVVGSELRIARRYAATALPLAAGGVVTLFGTFFAGHKLWDLYPPLAAFGLLALVAAVAVLLSIRRSSLVIAVLGLLGGFTTPILVATGEDRPLSLFGYLLLLNVALAWVSYKRRWTLLPWLSLAFTAFYQAGWVGRSLDETRIPLALGVFLVLAAVGFAAIRLVSVTPGGAARARWGAAAALPPAALALYLAASPSLHVPAPLLFGFLLLLAAGLAAVAAWQGPEWLHLAGAGFTSVTAAAALYRTAAPDAPAPDGSAWPLVLALGVVGLVYLAGPFLLAWAGRPFRAEARHAALAAPLFAAYASLSPSLAARWPVLLGFTALTAAGLAAAAARERREWLHVAGAAAALIVAVVLLSRPPPAPGAGLWPLVCAAAVFLVVYLGAPLLLARRGGGFGAQARLAALVAPAFALALSANPMLSERWPLLFGFLALAALGLAAVAAWQGPEWLHGAGAALTVAAVAVHLAAGFTPGDWPRLALYVALLAAAYLAAPLLLARVGREPRAEGRHAVLAAPLLLAAFVRAAPAETAGSPLLFLAPLLALAAAFSAWAVLRADARVHVLSSALAILAAAVWSGFHLEPARLYPALLAYLLLGGLLLAAPLWAEHRGRPLAGAVTSPLLLGALVLLGFLARPMAGAALGALLGLTALAAMIQAALFWEAARGRSLLLALAGVVVGFVELALWAVTGLAAALLPGLAAVAILAAVTLAGTLLTSSRAEGPAAPLLRLAPLLALAGHLFVAVVAAQRHLALPPWPWLAVLGVLDLGFVVAALLRRRGELALAAAVATQVVLWVHAVGLDLSPSAGLVAVGAALAGAALFLGGHLAGQLAARRSGAAPGTGAAPRAGLGWSGAAAVVALHGAQLLLLLLGGHLSPGLGLLLPAHLGLLAGLLALAWIAGAEGLALSSALLAGLGGLVLCVAGPDARGVAFPPGSALAVATAVWLVALAYPLLRGARGRKEWFPFVGAAAASALYLLAARKALLALGAGPYIGALPVAEAALLVPHLRMLLRMEAPSERDLRRLALVAASILGLVTVAIPLQLEKQWWTLGWALLAAALAWLWRRVPHRGILGWAAALLGASFVRLVPFFNVWIFGYHPRSEQPIWNWYLYTYLVVAGAHLLAAWWFSGGDDRPWRRGPRLCVLAGVSGALLLFLLLNIEIADYWSPPGGAIVFRFSAGVGSDLSYTVGWAVFAIGVLTAGVALRLRAVRIAAIALLAVTVVKGFLHDLGHLTGLYRVGSFVGLAFSLAVVALILQRFVLRRADAASPPAPTPPPPPPSETTTP